MSLDTLAEIFQLSPPNGTRSLTLTCGKCLEQITATEKDGRVAFTCAGGCTENAAIEGLAEIEPKFADWLETQMPRQGGDSDEAFAEGDDADCAQDEDSEPHLNGQVGDVFRWRLVLYDAAKKAIEHSLKTIPNLRELISDYGNDDFLPTVQKQRALLKPPSGLSATEIEEEVYAIAVGLRKNYAPAVVDDTTPARQLSIICEDQEQAVITNAEYLARPEVIERLGYSQSILLMIGGKHHGKTTNIRTLALSVPRGLPIWGRKTAQGPVVYAASDDEVASTRNELLNMGWSKKRDALKFVRIDPESDATPEQVLEDIAEVALKDRAILIILDMLFDFVGIKDELSYAQTRSAIGMVQRLSDYTKALVTGSHHTPKYLTDAHTATNAALGSQGISARFSPIIMTRKWADGLYTVESTMTRDPRGAEIKPTRISRNSEGWIELGGEFKEWMKWEIYAQRILDLFDGSSRGFTVFQIAEKLQLDRSRVQNTVKELENEKKLKREKRGRAYLYYLGNTDMFERENGIWGSDA